MPSLRPALYAVFSAASLSACSSSAPEAKPVAADDPNVETRRTIVLASDTRCRLEVQKGRASPEIIEPVSCRVSKTASGEINAVTAVFAAPCREYAFNNLIGELYFLDEKALSGRNAACPVESFNASYGWSLKRA